MVKSNDPAESRKTYGTGAERSTLDDVRFDLVSPFAYTRLRGVRADDEPLDGALFHIYQYIAGDTAADHLTLAGAILCIRAAQEENSDKMLWGMIRAARAYAEGAAKYSDHNWRKGFPFSSLLNHLIRHLVNMEAGIPTSEDELGHALWGVFALMEQEVTQPALDDRWKFNTPEVLGALATCPAVHSYAHDPEEPNGCTRFAGHADKHHCGGGAVWS